MAKRTPKDIRSTGRRRGRAALKKAGRVYQCECTGECGKTHVGNEKFPNMCLYTPEKQSRSDTLDVDHINKNLLDNDPVNLKWMCRKYGCHKNSDKVTSKGVSRKDNEQGYNLEAYGL